MEMKGPKATHHRCCQQHQPAQDTGNKFPLINFSIIYDIIFRRGRKAFAKM